MNLLNLSTDSTPVPDTDYPAITAATVSTVHTNDNPSDIIPEVNAFQQYKPNQRHDQQPYPGFTNNGQRFRRHYGGRGQRNSTQYHSSFDPEKLIHKRCSTCGISTPHNTKCQACGMNNVEIVQQINNIHNTKANECCCRGPAFNPHKQLRENTMQYNSKHGVIPPQYHSTKKVRFPQNIVATTQEQMDTNVPSDDNNSYDDIEEPSITPTVQAVDHIDIPPDKKEHSPFCGMTIHNHDETQLPMPHMDYSTIRL